jgi:putative protein kinase ArgK-like GTPase of G3E family
VIQPCSLNNLWTSSSKIKSSGSTNKQTIKKKKKKKKEKKERTFVVGKIADDAEGVCDQVFKVFWGRNEKVRSQEKKQRSKKRQKQTRKVREFGEDQLKESWTEELDKTLFRTSFHHNETGNQREREKRSLQGKIRER